MTFIPGTMFLIDTSALARIAVPAVREIIAGVIDEGMAATCVTVDLEACYSGRDAAEVKVILERRRENFCNLPIDQGIAERALQVQELMAQRGLHRAAGAFDLLTAAIAEKWRATVLHYDADFEHIASVTGQQQQWIVPRGSL